MPKTAKPKTTKKDDRQTLLQQLDNAEENCELKIEGNKIKLTNLSKILWPKVKSHQAITKRDYVAYLVTVSPWLLPHLRDRLLTLIRYPHGIDDGKFFQKHWEDHPAFVETVRTFTEHEDRDLDFLLCNNLSTLVWLAQVTDLELHTTHTRVTNLPDAKKLPKTFTGSLKKVTASVLNYPDYLVFDLDPYVYSGKEGKNAEPELNMKGFRKTCDLALWLKEFLDEFDIKAFVKTSGKTGLHIYVPIVRNIDYDTVRTVAANIGHHITDLHKRDVTMEWSVVKRTGKVFLDHNMNARSKSLASIYSLRASKEAGVSTPLEWDELKDVYPSDFTIEVVVERLNKFGDLWADILKEKNDLQKLLKGQSFLEKSV